MMPADTQAPSTQRARLRDYGISIGVMTPGRWNAITDVAGVRVGHVTLRSSTVIHTGVTAVVPAEGNLYQSKVTAGIYVGNGFGKLVGSTQVRELGNLETPIVLTNTLSIAPAIEAIIDHTLAMPGNEEVRSVNALVGETNDGVLNDIRGRHVKAEHVRDAIEGAGTGPVEEGSVGAGTGTVSFGYKSGIGSASRVLNASLGGYTVGVLVQSNFGGVLTIDGVPVGRELGSFPYRDQLRAARTRPTGAVDAKADADGSCMIVVATDAPLDARNLERLGKRAFMGLAKSGGIASNGSGDYAIAFTTHPSLRVPHRAPAATSSVMLLPNGAITPLFMAAIEATEEAILNALFAAEETTGVGGKTVPALPTARVIEILNGYKRTP